MDSATGLPGCFSGAASHPLAVSFASHARHRQPIRANTGGHTNYCVELWQVNLLRKSWRWSTLVHALQLAADVLGNLLAVLVKHRIVAPGTELQFHPSRELYDAWSRKGLSNEGFVPQRPSLAGQQLTDAYLDEEAESLGQVTVASSDEPACDVCDRAVDAERSTCVPCAKHELSARRYENTIARIENAARRVCCFSDLPPLLVSVPTFVPPPPILQPSTLVPTDPTSLRLGSTPRKSAISRKSSQLHANLRRLIPHYQVGLPSPRNTSSSSRSSSVPCWQRSTASRWSSSAFIHQLPPDEECQWLPGPHLTSADEHTGHASPLPLHPCADRRGVRPRVPARPRQRRDGNPLSTRMSCFEPGLSSLGGPRGLCRPRDRVARVLFRCVMAPASGFACLTRKAPPAPAPECRCRDKPRD